MQGGLVFALLTAGLGEVPQQGLPDSTSSVTPGPPEDPLFPHDISAWTYTTEFAERFKRLKLKEPGPTGAYAVNFQVHQVEELDRCVFNVFLDNTLPIDYPEGSVGFLSFTYPMSWFFLKLSPADQQAVDAAYHATYREPRAMVSHQEGEEPLTLFQYRTNLYRGVAVVTLAVPCDRVALLHNPLRLKLRTTSGQFHEVGLPDYFREWLHATLKKWRRPEAKVTADSLADHNVWSYTPEFAKRFGLPPLNEPGPTGAQAVAWRVVPYNWFGGGQFCFLDVYFDDTTPIVLPEAEHGFSGSQPQTGYFLTAKDKNDRISWYGPYSVYGNTELFFVRELSEKQLKYFPHKDRIRENLFRIVNRSPFSFDRYRKRAFWGLSYVAFDIGCMEPPVGTLGPVGLAVVKTDSAKHEVILPTPFTERVFQDWRVRVQIPLRCKTPKLYPREHCEKR
jgi:hypothetical protein